MRIDNAQAELRSLSLATIVQIAYRIPPDQVKAPGWLQDDYWDIIGKLPTGFTSKQVPEMLQQLLAQRFRIVTHYEDRNQPAYELIVGKGPLALKPSGSTDSGQHGCRGGPHHICQNTTMADLAAVLTTSARLNSMGAPGMVTWALDRPVIDKTGLGGTYDFVMDYGQANSSTAGAALVELSIADAVKALGLALKPITQTFRILVVDEIQRVQADN